MGIEKIEIRIRNAGQGEIAEIKKSAEKEIKRIEDEINSDALRAYQQIKEKRKQELFLIPKRIVSGAIMEKKRRIEEKKMGVVDNVFAIAKEKILSMNEDDKKKILKNLAEEGKKQVRKPVVYADKKYADLINANANNIGDFGVVIESEDKTLSIDNTLNNVMKRLEPDLKPRLAKVLFGEN